jgi:RNA polymerase subunit RPABC4/transcription elongation factor Spt4
MCCGEEIRPEPIEEDEKMRTTIVKGCLYCGLRLPEHADFCPECGRPVESAISIESEFKKMRTTIIKGCLYCGLRLPDSANFCPECGRPVEKGCIPYVIQESDSDCPDAGTEGENELKGRPEASSDDCDPFVDETTRMRDERAYVNAITMRAEIEV